jgi:hypothetical protein
MYSRRSDFPAARNRSAWTWREFFGHVQRWPGSTRRCCTSWPARGGLQGGFRGGFSRAPEGVSLSPERKSSRPADGVTIRYPTSAAGAAGKATDFVGLPDLAAAVAGVAGAVAGPFQVPLQVPEDRLNFQPMSALPPRSNGRSNSGGFPSLKDPSRIPDGSLREWPALPGRDAGYMPRTFGRRSAPGRATTSPPSIPPNHAKRNKYRQIQTRTTDRDHLPRVRR